jgi:hypothetical protein
MKELPDTNGETQEEGQTVLWGEIWIWLCYLGLSVMLYVLSSGPVVMAVQKPVFPYNSLPDRVLVTYLSPMIRVHNANPLIGKAIGMYWHLWVPKSTDSKGNPIPQHM